MNTKLIELCLIEINKLKSIDKKDKVKYTDEYYLNFIFIY
jgi:hypothetical protein